VLWLVDDLVRHLLVWGNLVALGRGLVKSASDRDWNGCRSYTRGTASWSLLRCLGEGLWCCYMGTVHERCCALMPRNG